MKKHILLMFLLQVFLLVVAAENMESAPDSMAESSDAEEDSEDAPPTTHNYTLPFARKDPSKEDSEDQEEEPKTGNTGSSQQSPQYSEELSGNDIKTLKPPKLNMSASLFTKVPEKREINPKNFPTTQIAPQTSSSDKIQFCIFLSLLIPLAI